LLLVIVFWAGPVLAALSGRIASTGAGNAHLQVRGEWLQTFGSHECFADSARSHFLHGYLLAWQCSEKFEIETAESAMVQLLEPVVTC
jgi:hypothetical protein